MSPPFTSAGRFEMSRVLSRLFGVLGRNFVPFAISALILTGLPTLALGLAQVFGDRPGTRPSAEVLIGTALWLPVYAITATVLQAVIIHGSVADLNGRKASLTEGLAAGLGRLLPLIGLSIVVGVLTVFGAVLLIVPAFMVAAAFSVAVPALIVERIGVFGAMQRSRDLTRGHRWSIFGLMVLYAVATLIAQMAGGVIAGVAAVGGMEDFLAVNALVVTPTVQVLNALVLSVGVASIYHELRFIKEGVGPEALARVFD